MNALKKTFLVCLVCQAYVLAGPLESALQVYGDIGTDFMQIVNSTNLRKETLYDSSWLDGYWLQAIDGNLGVDAVVNNRIRTHLDFAGSIRFGIPGAGAFTRQRINYLLLRNLYAEYVFGDIKNPDFTIRAGQFNVIYAAEKKIFGHYLINSGTYPGFVLSGPYEPSVRGLSVKGTMPGLLEHDFMILSEMRYRPYDDISLAYIGRLCRGRPVEAVAGVMFDRLFPVVDSVVNFSHAISLADSMRKGYVDFDHGREMTWYSLRGVKVMARVSVDLKNLLALKGRYHDSDMKIYSEIALLGVKNYKGWYEKIYERMPVMLGMNFPTRRFLDVLTLEMEYYRSPYWNFSAGSTNLSPVPNRNPKFVTDGVLDFIIEDPQALPNDKMKKDDFKWALFAEKTFGNGISAYVLAASDHFRDGGYSMDRFERLHSPDEWYWKAGVKFRF